MNQKALIETAEATLENKYDSQLKLLVREYKEKKENRAPVRKVCNRIQERINILIKK